MASERCSSGVILRISSSESLNKRFASSASTDSVRLLETSEPVLNTLRLQLNRVSHRLCERIPKGAQS